MMPTPAPELTVTAVAERLRAGGDIVLLDVREQWEYDIAHLPNAQLVPLDTVPASLDKLDAQREYVVYCHHGMRSAMAANWLRAHGFERVSNMTGGIDAWSVAIDPTVAQY